MKRLPLLAILAAAAPALAFGHALGRLGCFLVGDDYGKVSALPWAVAFPDGYRRRSNGFIQRKSTRQYLCSSLGHC
jgi:prolipoprotein diacylglyceryltransferase